MLKKLGLVISITLAMVFALGLVGCSNSESGTETVYASEVAKEDVLVKVNETNLYYYTYAYTYYDPDTKVMYLWIDGAKCGGLTVMVNPDGTPKLYEPQD